MKLIEPVEIPVLYDNDTTKKREGLGIDVLNEDYDIHNATFYQIDSISGTYDDGICNGTKIISNGYVFFTNWKYEETREFLKNKFI